MLFDHATIAMGGGVCIRMNNLRNNGLNFKKVIPKSWNVSDAFRSKYLDIRLFIYDLLWSRS